MINLNNLKEVNSSSQNLRLMEQLKVKWDEIHLEENVLKYKVANLRERFLDNKYLLQLNIDRGVKRRLPEEINNIHQPFDHNKFNFTKVSPKEVLFKILSEDGKDVHTLLVNVSPITQYHSLLCPSVNKCLPQIVTLESLSLALNLILLSEDRALRIGFNSLCAFASVNHLHYHIVFENNRLPVETAKCKQIKGPLYCLTDDYLIPGFCFEMSTEHSIETVSDHIYTLINYFLTKSIAHNIFMTRGKSLTVGDADRQVVRVVVWPRKSALGIKEFTAFNVAAFELSGWIVLYAMEDFERLQKTDVEKELTKWKLDDFDKLCNEVKSLF